MNWHLNSPSNQAHQITFEKCRGGEPIRVLLMSDEHVDNLHCDRKMIARHHEEAIAIGAPILKFGDTFCAMQGKWDKRADQNQLRPEHRVNNYLDALVETTSDFYSPWSKNIALISEGNHESSISRIHQTSLLDRLIERVQLTSGNRMAKGAYTGFVKFTFRKPNGTAVESKVLRWHHGYGGGGEVTRGMIDNNRTRGQSLADIYYSGHIHRRNMDENVITVLNESMNVEDRTQFFLRGSSYKDEHHGGNGWHIAQGREARPKGGWWLEFVVRGDDVTIQPFPAL